MSQTAQGPVTELLHQWQQGDTVCFDELSKLIYGELHRIAERYLRRTPDAMMQPTELINEAYIRLVGVQAPVSGRKHFYALAAKVMRQILTDRARSHSTAKRGGGIQAEPLDETRHGETGRIEEFLILDQALRLLAQDEPRLAQIVELHYFGGLTSTEIAELLGVPLWSVSRDHRLAEAWLRRALSQR